MLGSAMLAILAFVQTPFGFVLMFIPDTMLRSTGYKDETLLKDNRKLMIYRICGLWVVCASVIAGYGSLNMVPESQRLLCRFLTMIHMAEVAIKYHGIGFSIP